MTDGFGGGGNERFTNRVGNAPSAWLLTQNNDVAAEKVSPRPRGAQDKISDLLGLIAAIIVVWGLTWLFTTSPATSPEMAATSKALSPPRLAGAKAVAPASTTAASEAREDAAGVNPPSDVAPNALTSGVEGKLLSFLEHGPGKTAMFDLDRILFDADKATLVASSQDQLEQLAKILSAFPRARAEIVVHSGSGANKAQNAKLSFERAKAVRSQLVRLGVGPSLLTADREAKERLPASERAGGRERTQDGHVWIRVRKM